MAQQFTLAEAFVEFRAKGLGILGRQLGKVRSIAGKATGALTKMARTIKNLFTGKLAILGGLGIAAAGIGLLKLASDAEEMGDMFDDVFKENAKDMRRWSADLARSIGRSRLQIMEFAASMQDTFVPLGFARQEAAELSKVMVRLSTDVASFKNISDPQAAEAFTSALVGNHEAVRKFGIILTEATLKQQLLKMGFKGNANEASNQMKVLARLQIIMEGSTDAMGNAAKTSGSLANQWKKFTGILKDLGAALGGILAPAAKEILMVFSELAQIIEANRETFKKWGEAIGSAVSKVTKPLRTLARIMGQDFGKAWEIIKTAFVTGLAYLQERIRTFIDWMLAVVKQAASEMAKQLRAAMLGRDAPEFKAFKFKKGDLSAATKEARAELAKLQTKLFLQFAAAKLGLPEAGKAPAGPKGGIGAMLQRLFDAAAGGVAEKEKKKETGFEFSSFAGLWQQTQAKLGKEQDRLVKLAEKDAVVQNKILTAVEDIPLARWA
ncbi:MAG TPA: hypothetical protein VMY37_11785 [Thermoguttaceae bacterium]|nr:hypothetical protein [Thermoguttaceae bacterium]